MHRGSLELCVLAILARGTRYGYDIVQELAGGDALAIKEGTIYPLLNRLQSERLVTSAWQPSPAGPARKYYTLTDAGEARLAELRNRWDRFAADVERIVRPGAPHSATEASA
jgi:PadR family transcriptional regulator PadR